MKARVTARRGVVPGVIVLSCLTLAVLAGWRLLAPAYAAAPPGPGTISARDWLVRMNEALVMRTYDGEFLHLSHGQAERVRILHRHGADGPAERLVSLSGSGREIVRDATGVYCYLPDEQRVLVEPRASPGLLLATLPTLDLDTLERSYALVVERRARSQLGLPAVVIEIRPRDRYRFGYRLWLDETTFMPVRTELFDGDGRVLEQVLFVRLDFPARIAARDLKPGFDTRGYTALRQDPLPVAAPTALPWGLSPLPPGFKLLSAVQQTLPGSGAPARHLLLSDGLATVSVFVERPTPGFAVREGQAAVGSAYAMSVMVGPERVTAIGEVPPDTVRLIAAAIESAALSAR